MDVSAVSIGGVVAGRYRVDDVLGEGGMGVVYGVVDVETGKSLALKVVLEASADHVKRFEREGKATMRIESDHVVRVVDIGSIEERLPFMVMERLEGDTLKALVEFGPLPETVVADLMLQACEGLAHAHALGIVHRDVKPSNLFVLEGQEQTLKVLDFGISRMASYDAYEARKSEETQTVTDSGALLGSPQYTSPEQLQSPSSVDERADVWSLGVSMYYALTGALPFNGGSLAEVLVAVMSRPMAPLKASAPMVEIVKRCLTRSLDDRFRRVSDLAEALAPLASPERAALLPRIRSIAASTEPIVAPVPPSKLRDPSDKTLTFDDSLDQKATMQDLRSQRPPLLVAEPVTSAAVVVPARKPQPIIGVAFAIGLLATIGGGGLLVNRYRHRAEDVPQPPPSAIVAVAPPPSAAPATSASTSAEPEPESTDPKLELIADAPIAQVLRPASRRVELTDGKALVTVTAFKSDLPIEVELANGAHAKGIAKAGGPTTIRLTTSKAPPKGKPAPKTGPSGSELHKSPYE